MGFGTINDGGARKRPRRFKYKGRVAIHGTIFDGNSISKFCDFLNATASIFANLADVPTCRKGISSYCKMRVDESFVLSS